MGKVVRCPECAKVYRDLDELEVLRDNDSICVVCNAPIEVSDWDRVLASWDEDDGIAGIDDDMDEDWSHDDVDELFSDEDEGDEDEEDGLSPELVGDGDFDDDVEDDDLDDRD